MKYLFIIMALALTSCQHSAPKKSGRIVMPAAYQFCVDYPNHEECQDGTR